MNDCQASSLAVRVLLSTITLSAVALTSACGQKGPLFLPQAQGAAATPAHAPSAPDDAMPRSPLPPMPSGSSPGVPSGVVSAH